MRFNTQWQWCGMATKKKADENLADDAADRDDDEMNYRSSYRGGPVESVCGWNVFISGLQAAVSGTTALDEFLATTVL